MHQPVGLQYGFISVPRMFRCGPIPQKGNFAAQTQIPDKFSLGQRADLITMEKHDWCSRELNWARDLLFISILLRMPQVFSICSDILCALGNIYLLKTSPARAFRTASMHRISVHKPVFPTLAGPPLSSLFQADCSQRRRLLHLSIDTFAGLFRPASASCSVSLC
jgi:hypothetical protein